jgi:HEPN domain-containing protein
MVQDAVDVVEDVPLADLRVTVVRAELLQGPISDVLAAMAGIRSIDFDLLRIPGKMSSSQQGRRTGAGAPPEMTIVTSRADFEKLMDLRLKEAKLLLDQKDWDGAYYLVGYAVEFALKIRIISQLMKSDSFPEKKLAENFYKHELTLLRKLAGLEDEMNGDTGVSPQWDIVKDWNEQSRYEIGKTEEKAKNLYDAVEKGVLPWIKARWDP